MAVKLHRCKYTGLLNGIPGHACHRVEKALDEAGIDYEIVKVPSKRAERAGVIELTGQKLVPVIEFDDGSAYRAESKEMAAEIKAGRLFEHQAGAAATPAGAEG